MTTSHHHASRAPKPCHFDYPTGLRVIDDPDGGTSPCPADHCIDCGRNHTPTGTLVCPDCVGAARTDLEDIRWHARHLRWHASRAGRDGRLVAAAPIPGGDAMVLLARAGADYDDLRVARGYTPTEMDDDHHPDDLVPLLLPLVIWEQRWRDHFGHTRRATDRSPVTAITRYLGDQLTGMAQAAADPDRPAPDWVQFTRDIQALRRQLEGVLHDEKDPQRGVPCFECGERLVRRWGTPRPCTHHTPGRAALGRVRAQIRAAQAHLDAVRTYPELGEPTYAELRAARRTPTSAEESAARRPCDACAASRTGQGGIEDPSVGQSWECTGCRKAYTPGEYANAVRSHLAKAGPNGDGWTHIQMAADAASTQTGYLIPTGTVRRWMDRTRVASVCRWTPGARAGLRLVFWPDVAERAAEAVERAAELERKRQVREHQKQRLATAVAAGEDVKAAGERLGVHPARVARFVEEWETEARQTAS